MPSTPLNPHTQALIQMFLAAGAPPAPECTPAQRRERAANLPAMLGPGPDVAEVRNVAVPGPRGGIPARVYRPERPRATILYLHGGGWVVGTLDMFDAFARMLAVEAQCKVVSLEYALAPEYPFPSAVEDARAALSWVAEEELEGPLVVCGDSAGGNLATVCARLARDEGGPRIAMQVLAYPVVDHDFDTDSYREQADNPLLGLNDMAWYWDLYVPVVTERNRPEASPLRAADLSNLPPAYIVIPAHDPLHDEVLAYVRRLRDAGVEVTERHYDDQAHGFLTMVNYLPVADAAVAEIGAMLRRRF
ncbi:alpha/beta hydrolase [Mycobacterium sp. MBM]|nr:alpha/beta hydrolase [Mycobacterium sp. MBM]